LQANDTIADLIKECRERLNAAAIADSLDSFGYHHQSLSPGIKAIDPGLVLCGLARVGIYMPLYHDDEDTKVYEYEIALVDSLKPDEVPVLCCHGLERIAPWGDALSERSRYLGAAGMLTDGCVRDATRIRDLKFPVYSAGTNPTDTKYRGKMVLSDVPGEIRGVRVESGDLVFGDVDGTVIVPKAIMREALGKALEKVAAENVVRDEIRAGHSLVDIFERHGIL
jgi:4-hydroxy-4-methyl-2-oxoglutarate aldolase